MIVKNEAPVIRRCLESVRPIIDHWIIVDTGSTDGTQDLVRAALADLPGTLVERPWVDFAFNRTEALNLARPRGAYTLVIDADDELIIPAGFMMPSLDAGGCNVQILDENTRYHRPQLFNNAFSWRYRGVLHEFAECKEIVWTGNLPIAMRRGHDGARRRDATTYQRDAEILERALIKETDPFLISRYTFYLAQSYRDCSDCRKAVEYYLKRTELGYWIEEIYISFLSAALLMEALDEPFDRVLATFEQAIAVNPRRVEARYHASRYCRSKMRFVEGFHIAEAGLAQALPSDGLFLQPWMYQYGMRKEYSINALNTGQYRASLSACLELLDGSDLPAEDRPQSVKIARSALDKMLDPVWGSNHSAYSSEYSPSWQSSAL
ncbi:glycosyltransferase [Methylobacterium sp. NEAU K]|uniref:glycosyltransferase n=1 Tax=Methylobacterium sp. NEAU K TaxID=3064946 RepID=UPI0027349A6D|nr:glycosyltransferase [Methylobacterium sp. NEAU K]MDP4003121.1 glycosyltransferase [Methylobacterium sp. NEAU K]